LDRDGRGGVRECLSDGRHRSEAGQLVEKA
jgi:hypothetical protein